jgi:hypothetical protein
MKFAHPARFTAAIVLLLLGCGHRSANEGGSQREVDTPSPRRVFYRSERDIHCYEDWHGGYRPDQLKFGRLLDDKDIAVLAAVYNDVVSPGLTIEEGDSGVTPVLSVGLATCDVHNITPPSEFLQSITPHGYEVRGPDASPYFLGPDCELRLWAWIAEDTARVEVTASSQSRTALVILEDARWKACGSRKVGHINEIRVPKAK